MANSLHRDIEQGEVVVLDVKYFLSEYQALEQRAVKCVGGFGMSSYTMGNGLYGEFLSDGEKCRFEGYMINPKETKAYQVKHGKFLKPEAG